MPIFLQVVDHRVTQIKLNAQECLIIPSTIFGIFLLRDEELYLGSYQTIGISYSTGITIASIRRWERHTNMKEDADDVDDNDRLL